MSKDPIANAIHWAEAKANQAKLQTCQRHRFIFPADVTDGKYLFGRRLTCEQCGGMMPAIEVFRYIEGYKAAGCDPNDIMPGF